MARFYKAIFLILIVVCVITTSLYIPNCNYNHISAYAAGTKEVTCIVATLNIRKGPGTTYDKVQVNGVYAYMKNGDKATVTDEAKGWYGISFTFDGVKIEGYVSADYVDVKEIKKDDKKTDEKKTDDKKTDDKKTEEIKDEKEDSKKEDDYSDDIDDVDADKDTTVSKDTGEEKKEETPDKNDKKTDTAPAETAGQNGTVTVDGVTYIVQDGVYYDNFSCKGRSTVNGLRVRKGPSSESKQITSGKEAQFLNKDQVVTILAREEVKGTYWYKIQYKFNKKTVTGFVSADYITLVYKEGKAIKVKGQFAKNGYVRSATAMGSKNILKYNKKKVSYKKGKKIEIIGEKTYSGEKWFKIQFYYGKKLLEGYLRADYVDFRLTKAAVQPVPAAEQTGDPASGADATSGGAIGTDGNTQSESEAQALLLQNGVVVGGPVELRVAPGFDYEKIRDGSGFTLNVANGTVVTVYSLENDTEGNKWLLVTFEVGGYYSAGYIPYSYVSFNNGTNVTEPLTGFSSALTEAEFENYMTSQGFPESYKPFLRSLHTAHPYWEFRANHLGLDWTTALDNEAKVGKNLITNSKNVAWKSLESGAYNWLTDKFISFDGATWVTASRDAVAYFMDPRNFLNETEVYQFELLSYQPGYQTIAGIEDILKNTPMNYNSYSYIDDYGNSASISYSDTFMQAAEYSGVSPYHLASRAKQEVVTSVSTMSSSVSGTVSGLEGLYNFYNIGATQSTAAGGSVANGLRYANTGNSGKNCTVNGVTMSFNDYIKIPWTSPYRSIIGGGAYIGVNYIQRGQNTVYLEKFNMTATSTYSHQYMSNVEAAQAESIKTAAAYKSMVSTPLIFSIPVYLNMPETVCGKPVDALNPNNLLKKLEIADYTLTPSFDPTSDQTYSVIVDNGVTQVVVSGKCASSKASVTGLGEVLLNVGTNTVPVVVTAENGDSKVYIINIVRQE